MVVVWTLGAKVGMVADAGYQKLIVLPGSLKIDLVELEIYIDTYNWIYEQLANPTIVIRTVSFTLNFQCARELLLKVLDFVSIHGCGRSTYPPFTG